MTKGTYITHLLNILAYDTLIDLLTIAERYWLHREIIANYGNTQADASVTNTPQGRVLNISDKILAKKWKRPELRYNSFRELEEYNGTEWLPFNILDHV
jgi:hypothetical protein